MTIKLLLDLLTHDDYIQTIYHTTTYYNKDLGSNAAKAFQSTRTTNNTKRKVDRNHFSALISLMNLLLRSFFALILVSCLLHTSISADTDKLCSDGKGYKIWAVIPASDTATKTVKFNGPVHTCNVTERGYNVTVQGDQVTVHANKGWDYKLNVECCGGKRVSACINGKCSQCNRKASCKECVDVLNEDDMCVWCPASQKCYPKDVKSTLCSPDYMNVEYADEYLECPSAVPELAYGWLVFCLHHVCVAGFAVVHGCV